jgi:hypothetical protein
MRIGVALLPCLLGACSAWPSGSYVQSVSDADAAVLAPAIADYLSVALPSGSTVAVVPAPQDDPIAADLTADLDRTGIKQAPTSTPVRYVADVLDGGIVLRVSIADREGATRYFARAEDGSITPAGPLTVVQP